MQENQDTLMNGSELPSQTDKYFTPDIEDIRVGYECELEGSDKKWYPYKVELTKDSYGPLIDLDGNKRVPYLTKEQIEKEGWELNKQYCRHFGKQCIRLDGVQQLMEMEYDFKTYILKISYDCGEFMNCFLFEGICKDINTFRYICKLLNI